jgi:hypothetical protein
MPFAEAPPPQKRILSNEEAIWVVRPQIMARFFELKSFVRTPRTLIHELVPKLWHNEQGRQPFFARVWVDCLGNEENLSVKKKETVRVLETPNTPYWFCQKISGEKGFVPSAVLEPVE